jgi:hypothetical protein
VSEIRVPPAGDVLALAGGLRAVEERLDRLEAAVAAIGAARPVPAVAPAPSRLARAPPEVETAPPEGDGRAAPGADTALVRAVSHAGRLVLVLAGGYLLRAATEGGHLSLALGVALGFVYALLWLGAAARAGAAGRAMSATFLGIAAALVAYPLVVEATARFQVVSPAVAAAALAVFTACALLASARANLRGLAWTSMAGVVASAVLLAPRAGGALPFAVLFLLLAPITLAVARRRRWPGLAAAGAAAADVAVLFAAASVPSAPSTSAALGALAVLAALGAVYLGDVAVRMLRRGEEPTVADVVQTTVVLPLLFFGAVAVAPAAGMGASFVGLASLAAAGTAYAVGFSGVERGRRRSFHYATSVGWALLLLGSGLLFPEPAFAWAAVSVLAGVLGAGGRRVTLSLHATGFAVAAAFASGLVSLTGRAWVSSAAHAWAAPTAAQVAAFAALALCANAPVRADNPYWRELAVLPSLVATAFTVATGSALVLVLAARAAGEVDPATLATWRTVALSAVTLACGFAGRTRRLAFAALLVYPLLALAPVKFLLEDLLVGRPGTFWVTFLAYGVALILAPRWARRRAPSAAAPPAR